MAGPAARNPVVLRLALAGLVLRLAIVWSGLADNYLIADDAFYYFGIARNLATGHGASFDGIAPTNGFHPLWLLAITPLFALASALAAGPWLAVRLSLTLASVFDFATGWLLFDLLRRLGFTRGAIWAAALWWLFPTQVLVTLRGLESATGALACAAFTWWCARALGRATPRAADGAVLGLLLGLAFLARTDNGVLLPLATLAAIAMWVARGRMTPVRAFGFLAACAIAATLVAAPWFAWNLATFGSPWQVSGVMKLHNPHLGGHVDAAVSAHGLSPALARVIAMTSCVWRPIQFAVGEVGQLRVAMVCTALALLALAALVRPAWRAAHEGTDTPRPAIAALLAVYVLGHMVVYAWIVPFYAVWYAPAACWMLLALLVGMGADAPLGRRSPGTRRALALALAVAGLVSTVRCFQVTGVRPRGQELNTRGVIDAVERRAEGVHTIGAFSAGAIGYFAPTMGPYRVVNLDGLVNNALYEAWRKGEAFEYLSRTIDMAVINAPAPFEHMLGPGGARRFRDRFPPWPDDRFYYGARRAIATPEPAGRAASP